MVNIENFQPIELKELEWSSEIDNDGNQEVIALRTILDGYNTQIRYSASELKTEKTGLHGKLKIYYEGYTVASDYCNISKMAQRNAVGKESYTHPLMESMDTFYPLKNMKIDLTTFADNCHSKYVELVDAEVIEGDSLLEVGEWAKGLILKGGGTFINALPKSGKSYISMALAVSIDAGCNEIWEVEQANAMYINLERSERSMIKRLGGVNTALGLDPARSLPFLNVRGQSLGSIQNNIKHIMDKRDIKFIVVDSISRAGMGSLVDDKTGISITDILNNLIEETDRSYLAIAHRGWENSHVFGSVHYFSACDLMVQAQSSFNANKDLGVLLKSEGSNDTGPTEFPVIKLEFDDFGLRAMSKSSEDEFPDLADDNRAAKDRIREYLLKSGKQPVANIETELGIERNTINATLTRNKNLFQKFGGFWGVRSE